MNTKKCLITIVSVLFMTAGMHAQEASDLTAEKQLAQRKAELDAREKALNEREKILAEKEETIVLYESPHKILKTLEQLCEFFGEERIASVSRELSKMHEETLRGTLRELANHFQNREPRGEIVVVIGGRQ